MRIRELGEGGPYGPSVVVSTVRGMPKITTPLRFHQVEWLRIDGGCYMKTCSAT